MKISKSHIPSIIRMQGGHPKTKVLSNKPTNMWKMAHCFMCVYVCVYACMRACARVCMQQGTQGAVNADVCVKAHTQFSLYLFLDQPPLIHTLSKSCTSSASSLKSHNACKISTFVRKGRNWKSMSVLKGLSRPYSWKSDTLKLLIL